jgi:2,3-dihydroxybiphenyl 1,2-dioxygenase
MTVSSLGYIGIAATDLAAWRRFASGVLAMEAGEGPRGGLALRMDEKWARLLIEPSERDGLAFFGWEVADSAALDRFAATLERHGIRPRHAGLAEREERGVTDLVVFDDPLGHRVELFCGLAEAGSSFAPPRPIAGFRTGALGLGHAVIAVPEREMVLPFYRDVLGLKVSDYTNDPFKAIFLRANSRHHSLAFIETGKLFLHHLMVELLSLDDLGRAYDRALEDPDAIGVTLGRHTNDHVTSFYVRSPSGFLVEIGWGGRDVDEATWQVAEMKAGPSFWGHERRWLGEDARREARRLRLAAAEAGLRAPVHVAPGEYEPIRD